VSQKRGASNPASSGVRAITVSTFESSSGSRRSRPSVFRGDIHGVQDAVRQSLDVAGVRSIAAPAARGERSFPLSVHHRGKRGDGSQVAGRDAAGESARPAEREWEGAEREGETAAKEVRETRAVRAPCLDSWALPGLSRMRG
jgi:hypothetical protein